MAASVSSNCGEPTVNPDTTSCVIQGGSLRTFPFPTDVKSVQVLIMTNGRPMNARLELLQGPNNQKQIIDFYSEDGLERPFCAVIATPGSGNVLRLVNTSPLEFPIYSYVEPWEYGIDEVQAQDDGVMLGPAW